MKVLSPIVSALLAMSAVAPLSAQELEDTLVIRTTGGQFEQALKKHFFDPFTEETGIRVIPVSVSYGEMMAKSQAMIDAGRVEWDIISPQFDEVDILGDIVEDIGDCSEMPNVAALGVPGSCKSHGVLYLIGGRPMVYDPSAFPNGGPKTWADYWNVEEFPGRRAMPNAGSSWNELVYALLADGVKPEELWPLDIERAFKKLDEVKPHIQVWWKTGDQSQQLMRTKDVALNIMFSGRAFASKQRGDEVEYSLENAVADWGAWSILKGAPHPNAAKAFINFYMANPEAHAAFAREMGYATSSLEGQSLLTDEERQVLGATPDGLEKFIHIDAKWLDENRAVVNERWNAWVSE